MKCTILAVIFAVLNRARGSKLFNLTTSTGEGRLVSTLCMALTVTVAGTAVEHQQSVVKGCIPLFGLLMLWCSFAWDGYWGLAIGNDSNNAVRVFAPVDSIMKPLRGLQPRLYGTLAMGLRQMLLAPAIVLEAVVCGHAENVWMAVFPLFFGVPYLIAGYALPNSKAVAGAECVVGALMGCIFAGVQS